MVDIFAGCGGMSFGFLRAKLDDVSGKLFESVYAVESDRNAAATYELNIGHSVDTRKIEDVPNEDLPGADVVIGGPPCQPFSALNRRRDDDHRRELWQEYARVLDVTEPAYFVMENVPQLLSSPEYAVFKEEAEADGWKVVDGVLLAADFGVPQMRRRAIVLGSRFERLKLPSRTHRDMRKKPRASEEDLEKWADVRTAIGHLPLDPDGEGWHRSRNPTDISRIRYTHVAPNGNRFSMQASLDAEGLGHLVPPCWRNKTTGTTDVFGRMNWELPAPTIRTEFYKPEKGRYLHPVANRPITIHEGALLMGFPEEGFDFPTDQPLTHVGRQIGNAVPPLLAQRIAEVIARDAVEQGLLAPTEQYQPA